MNHYRDFEHAISSILQSMKTAPTMHRGNWQGVDVSRKPEMQAFELLHQTMAVPMQPLPLDYYREQIKPNLPWADDHFAERICGQPINPGIEWRNWPWGENAEKFLMPNGLFDHNYMERYWPKRAGCLNHRPTLIADEVKEWTAMIPEKAGYRNVGYRFEYGDLNDVITELEKNPTTRQAILPIFFPEDTGYRPGRRKPCSISYHFILTNKYQLDIFYHLRSCDLVRHFRDDIYLTVRLLLWTLSELRSRHKWWNGIAPGTFAMYIGNLHCFRNDMHHLRSADDATVTP